ncbi:MAG: bifunctional metallophosphatase/5'-nucleotidase [Prevotella sp.]|nr:bifunctional metallophosphatase/5'-nucleotidase [Prevotella sp.]
MKKTVILLVTLLLTLTMQAERKEIHILSANDMHAALEAFPALADVADSLRALYPDLLIFAAGDNRTGDPLNDMYEIPAYPMVALMNQIGFNATTLGNHEFDSGSQGLARLIGLSSFSYLCANCHPADSLGIHLLPCQVFDVSGTKVGVVGAVQLGTHGHPDTHPDNCRGIAFTPVNETVAHYEWLRQQCDVVILLSHNGFEADVETSALFPWLDLIIGGHTHTQLDGGELHNGILITQNVNRLQRVTHITLILDGGKVVDKRAENIDVRTRTGCNKVVAELVRYFSDNPAFRRVLTQAEQPFTTYEELGSMMCDAFAAETGADVAIENFGGVRYGEHSAGPFTVSDVLRLDPFGNDAVVMEITGAELRDMLISCCDNDANNFPYVSGVLCDVVRNAKDTLQVKNLTLRTPDGRKFDLKRRYKVVTNSYVASIADAPRNDQGQSINRKTADLIISYLERRPSVNYQGVKRIFETRK